MRDITMRINFGNKFNGRRSQGRHFIINNDRACLSKPPLEKFKKSGLALSGFFVDSPRREGENNLHLKPIFTLSRLAASYVSAVEV
jgi:hypothetical protein